MEIKSTAIIIVAICFGVIILTAMLRSKHFFKCFVLSALSGFAALFSINLLSGYIGFSLAVNPITLSASAIGGVPAVILLLISRVFLL
ncbi:MAG: pro-sigmaK processing inhibitor BofA family protein [Clostridia bacterium]|nr:pro-sigmaK processing inhibitor BofA family protein [Clostridia bacterium]